jgi:hypothetical protein
MSNFEFCTLYPISTNHRDCAERRRFSHVKVICMYRNTVLAGRRAMGEGVSLNGAVGSEQGTGKDGDFLACTKSCHSK